MASSSSSLSMQLIELFSAQVLTIDNIFVYIRYFRGFYGVRNLLYLFVCFCSVFDFRLSYLRPVVCDARSHFQGKVGWWGDFMKYNNIIICKIMFVLVNLQVIFGIYISKCIPNFRHRALHTTASDIEYCRFELLLPIFASIYNS